MDKKLIAELCETIEQFNKANNLNLHLLLSPTLKYKIVGFYCIKNEIEPVMEKLINYPGSINLDIKENTVIFESQNKPCQKEIIYLFNIK